MRRRPIPVLVDTNVLEARRFRFSSHDMRELCRLCDSDVCDLMLHRLLDIEVAYRIDKLVRDGSAKSRILGRDDGRILIENPLSDEDPFGIKFSPDKLIDKLLRGYNTFKAECAGRYLGFEHEDVPTVSAFFGEGVAPFKFKGDSDGFPDAFALTAAQNWSRRTGRQIHAVSEDGDWERACEEMPSVTLHKSLNGFIKYVESARPLDFNGGSVDKMLDRISESGGLSSSHLSGINLEIHQSIHEVPPPSEICNTPGDLLEYARSGRLILIPTSNGIHIRTLGAEIAGVRTIARQFPNRIAFYCKTRLSDEYKFISGITDPSWPEEYVMYASWLFAEPDRFGARPIPSLGSGITIPSWDNFVELTIGALESKFERHSASMPSHLRTAYVVHGATNEAAFRLESVSLTFELSSTGT